MAAWLVLTLILLRSLIRASSPSTNNPSISSHPATNLSTPVLLNCANRAVDQRPNVKAIDCLNLFTYILATEPHRTQQMIFGLLPGQRPGTKVFDRRTGTCEFFLVLGGGSGSSAGKPPAETSTLDTVMGVALEIVSNCLLDNRPESTHWAGCAKFSYTSNLKICIAGPLPEGQDAGGVNATLSLDPRDDEWVDNLLES